MRTCCIIEADITGLNILKISDIISVTSYQANKQLREKMSASHQQTPDLNLTEARTCYNCISKTSLPQCNDIYPLIHCFLLELHVISEIQWGSQLMSFVFNKVARKIGKQYLFFLIFHLQPRHDCSILFTFYQYVLGFFFSCQSPESPAYLWLTDLVWTLHCCIRISECVGNQRCQHQGCWKAHLMDSSILFSPKSLYLMLLFFCCFFFSFFPLSQSCSSFACRCLSQFLFSAPSMVAHYLFSQCVLSLSLLFFLCVFCRPLLGSSQFTFSGSSCGLSLLF